MSGAAAGRLTEADAARLRECVTAGGLAVFPSDTVYGICCDPADAAAVGRLYELKQRPPRRAAAVMFFELELALASLPELSAPARRAMRALLPGGVTLLLGNPARRWPAACAQDPATLGLRVPRLPAPAAALAATGVPVMQSSANISGGGDARRLQDVSERLRRGADLVLDAGELPGTPSTVIDLRAYEQGGAWRIARAGAVPAQAVAAALAGAPGSDG